MLTMRAVHVKSCGGIEALESTDVSIPKPDSYQVLVKNAFSGVNFHDMYDSKITRSDKHIDTCAMDCIHYPKLLTSWAVKVRGLSKRSVMR